MFFLMKPISFIKMITTLLLVILAACNNANQTPAVTSKEDSTETKQDGTAINTDTLSVVPDTAQIKDEKPGNTSGAKIYSNQRFKDVTIEKTGERSFLIKGKGQIFEASFSWIIEDGHEELQQGHTMTDAGAPEWGNFNFTVNAPMKRPNSTLHLILFETSAKDGSRQYELPIPLY